MSRSYHRRAGVPVALVVCLVAGCDGTTAAPTTTTAESSDVELPLGSAPVGQPPSSRPPTTVDSTVVPVGQPPGSRAPATVDSAVMPGGAEDPVLVIAHRGASDVLPEHTMQAYELAVEQCADFLEIDVVPTLDGTLVTRHENELSRTTDIEERPEFADRRRTKVIDGAEVSGWFTEDFAVGELKTLIANGSSPAAPPAPDAYRIATFEEVVESATRARTCAGGPVGIYVETKRPSYFASIGRSLEPELLRVLEVHGVTGSETPVYIQSFETSNLRQLDGSTDIPLVQLLECRGAPYDLQAAGDSRTYADLTAPASLQDIATYADAVGACKDLVIPRDDAGDLLAPSALTADAHAVGLDVHVWTFQRYNRTLPRSLQGPGGPDAIGDAIGEMAAFIDAGADGLISDNPDLAVAATRG